MKARKGRGGRLAQGESLNNLNEGMAELLPACTLTPKAEYHGTICSPQAFVYETLGGRGRTVSDGENSIPLKEKLPPAEVCV